LNLRFHSSAALTEPRCSIIDTETDEAMLTYVEKYEYASRDHVIIAVLWHTMVRAGGLRALDLEDYKQDEQFLSLVHRPDTGTQLKNGASGQRLVSLSEDIGMLLDDYIAHRRKDATDEHGRRPLATTRNGRISPGAIRKTCYSWSRPCAVGLDCPHGREPDECEAAVRSNEASKRPSSEGSHAFRRGGITHYLSNDVPQEVVSNRANVSADILEKHYDERSAKKRMEQRRQYLGNIQEWAKAVRQSS